MTERSPERSLRSRDLSMTPMTGSLIDRHLAEMAAGVAEAAARARLTVSPADRAEVEQMLAQIEDLRQANYVGLSKMFFEQRGVSG